MASASGWRTARRTTQTPRRPNGAGGARGANRSGSASVTSIHAPFTTEVECKMASFTHVENFGVHASRLIQIDGHDPVRVSLEAPLKYGPELQLGIMQLEREGSPPPGLRLPQAKLSRKSNQVARGRIRRFESYMPMVLDHEGDHASRWAAVVSIAAKIGCTPQTLNEWVKKAEVDSGHKPGLTSDMAAKMKALEREKRELRQANAHDFLREGEVVLTSDDGPWPKNTQMHRPRTGGAASTWLGRQDSIRLKKPCFRGITAQKERMWSPFRSRCNGAAEPLRLHMKHGVSDATIYPLRMLASAILRGLKQIFFSYGCVSGFRGHQNPSVESRTEQRARPRRSWRDQRNNASRGTAGAAGRGDVMKAVFALVISWIVLVPGDCDDGADGARPSRPDERELRAAQEPRASADLRTTQGNPLPRESAGIPQPGATAPHVIGEAGGMRR